MFSRKEPRRRKTGPSGTTGNIADQNRLNLDESRRIYQQTVDFCAKYDEVSFDPAYKNEPMSTFEPMVRRLLNRPWLPPASVGDR
jgi:hypothetical protein